MHTSPLKRSTVSFMAGLGTPGSWSTWRTPHGFVIMVCCPQCKRLITLSKEHKIADDGTVTPSCVCPTSYCQYHANVKLQDWKPEGVKDAQAKQG